MLQRLGDRLGVAGLRQLQRGLVGVAGAPPGRGRRAPVAAQARGVAGRAALERLAPAGPARAR